MCFLKAADLASLWSTCSRLTQEERVKDFFWGSPVSLERICIKCCCPKQGRHYATGNSFFTLSPLPATTSLKKLSFHFHLCTLCLSLSFSHWWALNVPCLSGSGSFCFCYLCYKGDSLFFTVSYLEWKAGSEYDHKLHLTGGRLMARWQGYSCWCTAYKIPQCCNL